LAQGEDAEFLSDEPRNVSVFTPGDAPGQTYLTSPSFTVATVTPPLYFQQAFNFADPDDGGILEVAIGGEPFADIVQAGGVFLDDSYNTILSDRNPLGVRRAWSGNSGGWIPVYVSLPPKASGQQVRLRWRLGISRGLRDGFWFIDSVLLTEPYCPPRDLVMINPLIRSDFFTFGINTETNRTYVIECKADLTDPSWKFVQSISGDGNLQTIVIPAGDRQRFYHFFRQ